MPDNVIHEISEQSFSYVPKNKNSFHESRRTSLPNLQELYQKELDTYALSSAQLKKNGKYLNEKSTPLFNQTMKSFYDAG